ncbi:MAG: diaminopimelate decarboxylase [Actinomycetota bacterium]|jgi:diaminopimelate decarboxylase
MANTDLNELNPMIWPDSARRSDFGELTIGGVGVRALVEQYGSPLFIFDEEHVRNRARNYVKAFNTVEVPTDVYYASKAFLSVKVAKWLAEEGLGIDVCTAGELEVALRAGVNPSRILFHGNNKSVAELEKAVEVGVGRIVVDSLIEIQRLDQIAARNGITQQVLVRVTLGVEAHTHEAISTAHEDQKFGLSIASGAALDAIESVVAAPALNLLGLHSHIGSQIFDASGFEISAHRIVELANQVRQKFDFTVTELNVGGGMGIAYVPSDDPLNVEHMAKAIHDIITSECARTNFPLPHLAVEPGRAIIGGGAVTVYEVGTVKPVDVSDTLVRHYISVDGGISDNIRTALYDAQYTVSIASRESTGVPVASRVVGKHCESGDIVVRDTQLPADLVPGDLLAVAATGAYCRAMASNYNYLPKPAVISTKDGKSQVLLRRETIEDLLALDAGITN